MGAETDLWVPVVDCMGQYTHLIKRRLQRLGVTTGVIPVTTPFGEIREADGLVLSGGAPRIGFEAEKLDNLKDYLDHFQKPVLAICVSHQYLAIHYGGTAGVATRPEYGPTMVEIVGDDPLLEGIPNHITVWSSHNDEIKILPPCFKTLARSTNCAHQIIKHCSLPYYGVQFHPEVSHTEHGLTLLSNFVRICSGYSQGRHTQSCSDPV
ncbi:MAG: GMP synthase subunit A [Methanobacteriota archaeon]|nr:MAG: GMP synthase subunit A [Euryarchaeota archaeon]